MCAWGLRRAIVMPKSPCPAARSKNPDFALAGDQLCNLQGGPDTPSGHVPGKLDPDRMIVTNCSLFRQGGSAGTDNLRQIEKRSEQTRMEEKMDRTAEAGRRVPVQKQSCFAAILAHPTGPVFLPIPSCGRMTRNPETMSLFAKGPLRNISLASEQVVVSQTMLEEEDTSLGNT
jgi:hypothetical protein